MLIGPLSLSELRRLLAGLLWQQGPPVTAFIHWFRLAAAPSSSCLLLSLSAAQAGTTAAVVLEHFLPQFGGEDREIRTSANCVRVAFRLGIVA
jgi:hypothetical protein